LQTVHDFRPDLVVVGGGMGGVSCAKRATRLGARVLVAEPGPLGGT
jgi:glutathione reductase (NADPH)